MNPLVCIFRLRLDLTLRLLVKRGMKFGSGNFVDRNAHLDTTTPQMIEIGDNCTFTSGVVVLGHDESMLRQLGYRHVGKTVLGNHVFVGANSIILPGVKIGNEVIIGAGSVVTHDIPSDSVVYGNPAKVVCSTSDFLMKHKNKISEIPEAYIKVKKAEI